MSQDRSRLPGLTALGAAAVARLTFSAAGAVGGELRPCAVCGRNNDGKPLADRVLWPAAAFECRKRGWRTPHTHAATGAIFAFLGPWTTSGFSDTCARCLYIGRFNAANRRAAESGAVLPEWGRWQPSARDAEFGYNPFTGHLLGLPLVVDPEVPEGLGNLRRAPRGWHLRADGTATSQAPGTPDAAAGAPPQAAPETAAPAEPQQLAMPLAQAPTDPLRPWTAPAVAQRAGAGRMPAKYPFKCAICSRLGDAGEDIAFRANDGNGSKWTAHWACWDAGGLRVGGPQMAADAARLYAAGYRQADFRALCELCAALEGVSA